MPPLIVPVELVRFTRTLAPIDPPVILTLFASWVAIVPKPKAVLAPDWSDAPVPPLVMASVPAIVIVPELVTGPPLKVRPVLPPATSMLVTPAAETVVLMVKLGYVPETVVPPPPIRVTVWSGAVLASVIEPVALVTEIAVPAVIAAKLKFEPLPISN